MSFVEVEFAYFMPALLALYWLGPRRAGYQNTLALTASFLFYATWDWQLLFLLLAGTLTDFVIGSYLERVSPDNSSFRRRLALAASLSFSFGALAFFKYENFFALQANALLESLGIGPAVPLLHLALPLGISYYTLQRVGYILDVYWQRQAASKSLLEFASFCAFFPQLTAGPISRARELLPQLAKARVVGSPAVGRWRAGLPDRLRAEGMGGDDPGNHGRSRVRGFGTRTRRDPIGRPSLDMRCSFLRTSAATA